MAMVGLAPEDDDGESAAATGPAEPVRGRTSTKQAAPAPKDEPPHVKDAKAILEAAKKVAPDEWAAFFDGLEPRLADIKKASANTYNTVIERLGQIEAALRIAA